jgi:hypothetical protein
MVEIQGVLTKSGDENYQPDANACCASCRGQGEDHATAGCGALIMAAVTTGVATSMDTG